MVLSDGTGFALATRPWREQVPSKSESGVILEADMPDERKEVDYAKACEAIAYVTCLDRLYVLTRSGVSPFVALKAVVEDTPSTCAESRAHSRLATIIPHVEQGESIVKELIAKGFSERGEISFGSIPVDILTLRNNRLEHLTDIRSQPHPHLIGVLNRLSSAFNGLITAHSAEDIEHIRHTTPYQTIEELIEKATFQDRDGERYSVDQTALHRAADLFNREICNYRVLFTFGHT